MSLSHISMHTHYLFLYTYSTKQLWWVIITALADPSHSDDSDLSADRLLLTKDQGTLDQN